MKKDRNPPQHSANEQGASMLPLSTSPESQNLADAVRILGAIDAAQTDQGAGEKYSKLATKCVVTALEAENADLRNQVVELALAILELQSRVNPHERSRWANIGARWANP